MNALTSGITFSVVLIIVKNRIRYKATIPNKMARSTHFEYPISTCHVFLKISSPEMMGGPPASSLENVSPLNSFLYSPW